MNKETLSLLGLCTRARKLVSGASVLDAVRSHKACLVLYASDASERTKKQIRDKTTYYGVEAIEVNDSEMLSAAIGKSGRMAVAIIESGLAKKIKEKLRVGDTDGKNE